MFVPLKSVLPDKIKKLGIKKQIETVNVCKKVEEIINSQFKNLKVGVLRYKDQTIFIKTGNFHISNELKLKELSIKKKFKENNLNIKEIKYVI